MKIYTIEENCYEDLTKVVEKMQDVVRCAKKVMEDVEESSMGWKRSREDEEDYDWRIKKGYRSRY